MRPTEHPGFPTTGERTAMRPTEHPGFPTTGERPATPTTGEHPSGPTTGEHPGMPTTGEVPTTGERTAMRPTGEHPGFPTTGEHAATPTTGERPGAPATGERSSVPSAGEPAMSATEDVDGPPPWLETPRTEQPGDEAAGMGPRTSAAPQSESMRTAEQHVDSGRLAPPARLEERHSPDARGTDGPPVRLDDPRPAAGRHTDGPPSRHDEAHPAGPHPSDSSPPRHDESDAPVSRGGDEPPPWLAPQRPTEGRSDPEQTAAPVGRRPELPPPPGEFNAQQSAETDSPTGSVAAGIGSASEGTENEADRVGRPDLPQVTGMEPAANGTAAEASAATGDSAKSQGATPIFDPATVDPTRRAGRSTPPVPAAPVSSEYGPTPGDRAHDSAPITGQTRTTDFRNPASAPQAPGSDFTRPPAIPQAPGNDFHGPASAPHAPSSDFTRPPAIPQAPGNDFHGPASAPHAPSSDFTRPPSIPQAPGNDLHGPASAPQAPGGDFTRPPAIPQAPGNDFHGPASAPQAPGGEYIQPPFTPQATDFHGAPGTGGVPGQRDRGSVGSDQATHPGPGSAGSQADEFGRTGAQGSGNDVAGPLGPDGAAAQLDSGQAKRDRGLAAPGWAAHPVPGTAGGSMAAGGRHRLPSEIDAGAAGRAEADDAGRPTDGPGEPLDPSYGSGEQGRDAVDARQSAVGADAPHGDAAGYVQPGQQAPGSDQPNDPWRNGTGYQQPPMAQQPPGGAPWQGGPGYAQPSIGRAPEGEQWQHPAARGGLGQQSPTGEPPADQWQQGRGYAPSPIGQQAPVGNPQDGYRQPPAGDAQPGYGQPPAGDQQAGYGQPPVGGQQAGYGQPPAVPGYGPPGGMSQPYQQGAQHPHGPQPSLDDVPLRRAKKSPSSGWRKAVHHVSGGAINPGLSAEELRLQELVARIRQPVRGDYRIAVLSLKGGVGKTTTTMGLGSIFASIRGDRVIAVDANPDFGTLSQRVPLQTRSTVRDLLLDPAIQRYSDVRRHTSQGTSRLEVLASERDPAASEAFNDEEYRAVARILQRFYNIILTDCGTGLMHSAMGGVLDLAHSLVLISSAAIDGARSAAATLDWLSLHGHDHLVRNAVVVINLPREGSPNVGIQQLREYFLSRCRAVHIIPYDSHLSEGAEIDLHRLHKTTKRAYVELAATVADEFGIDHRRYGG
ncbi:AAA family ATPase [Nocardia sp. CA-119907]|uniref:MinD/ParA family ATP-binding protein n=1 Tax=Nocardia sp. CA-119907 TaxID=3239973 RepID=UPI003D9870DB